MVGPAVFVVVAALSSAPGDAADDAPSAGDDADDASDGSDASDDDAGAGDSAGTHGVEVRARPSPGAPFVAVAGSKEAAYVLDAAGVVHATADRGRTFRASRPPMGPAPAEGEGEADATDSGDMGEAAGTDLGNGLTMQQNYGWVGDHIWLDIGTGPMFGVQSAGALFAFPYGTTGEEYLEFTPDSPAFWDPPWLQGMERPDSWTLDPTLTAKLGVQRARSLTLPLSAPATALATDPDDARVVFVAGPGGLARSDDGAVSWASLDDGPCNAVGAGGGRGFAVCNGAVLVVDEHGAVWRGAEVAGARFVAGRGDDVVVGFAGGIATSRDGGASFGDVVPVDGPVCAAVDGVRTWVGTGGGLVVSGDGGSSFNAVKGAGEDAVVSVTASFAAGAGKVFVATGSKIEESTDGGDTFRSVDVDGDVAGYAGGLVLLADAVLDVREVAPPDAAASEAELRTRMAALRKEKAEEPAAELVFAGAHSRLAPLDEGGGGAGWFPRVDVVGGVVSSQNTALLDAIFLDQTKAGDAQFVRQTAQQAVQNGKPAAFNRVMPYVNPYVELFLSWDLPSLFQPASSPTRRREAQAAQDEVDHQVADALDARALLVEDLTLRGNDDAGMHAKKSLALEEADARLFALSGVRFPALDDVAAKDLSRTVDAAHDHLGVGDARVDALNGAGLARAVTPALLIGGSWVETALDENDFLDEIGIDHPWIAKSARGHILEGRARLTWDLPHSLRNSRGIDIDKLARLRRDVALDVVSALYAEKRAALEGTALDVEESRALVAGLTGTNEIESESARTVPAARKSAKTTQSTDTTRRTR